MRPFGEVVVLPFEISQTESDLSELARMINRLDKDAKVVMESRIEHLLNLAHLLDYTMPGVKACFSGWSESSGKDKLCDFVEEYWHYDNITKRSEKKFVEHYQKWAKKKGYQFSETKALQIYSLAKNGIPTIPSNAPSTKMLLLEAVKALRKVNGALFAILTRMKELAKKAAKIAA